MAKFKYTAIDKSGNEVSSVIEATSESRAKSELSSRGLNVTKISELLVTDKPAAKKRTKPFFGTGVTNENVTIFSRQLATLLKAGLPLLKALEVIAKQEKNPYFQAIIEKLCGELSERPKEHDWKSCVR